MLFYLEAKSNATPCVLIGATSFSFHFCLRRTYDVDLFEADIFLRLTTLPSAFLRVAIWFWCCLAQMCRVIFESVDYEILSAEATSMSLHSSSIYIISGHPSIKKPSFCLIAWRSTKTMWRLIRNRNWCRWFHSSLFLGTWFPGNYQACYLLISWFTEHQIL